MMLDNADVLIPETDLIWSMVEVFEDEWDFSFVDKYLDFCEKHGIEPIGHCLIWKGIGWMTDYRPNGEKTDAELKPLFMSRMEDYIKTMLTRYKGIYIYIYMSFRLGLALLLGLVADNVND